MDERTGPPEPTPAPPKRPRGRPKGSLNRTPSKMVLLEAKRARQAGYQAKHAAKKKVIQRKAPIEIALTVQHHVNNIAYGPGVVTVPRDLASVLLEQERNASRQEANFLDRQPVVTLMTVDRRLIRYPHGTDLNMVMGRAF